MLPTICREEGGRTRKKVTKFGCSNFEFILKLNLMLKIGMQGNLNVVTTNKLDENLTVRYELYFE
jgi:hypothetical protein